MNKPKKIILAVTNNLENDQRVNKVASSLSKFGYNVCVLGSKSRPCHHYSPGYETKRLNVFFKKGILFYAEINIRFLFYLLFHHADVITANDTDTILPVWIAATIKRIPWVADLHELFPEVPEVTNRKRVKRVWTKIEDLVFPHIRHGYTVCQSIANHYKNKYNIDLGIIRNIPQKKVFTGKKDLFKKQFGNKKVILYQGAVNVGRGIEWAMDAMQYVENAVMIVIGNGDLYPSLSEKAKNPPYAGKVYFLGAMPYNELQPYTESADLGLCLLKHQGLSYYYALPNRIFDFMQARTPIIATGFPEIKKILDDSKTGITVSTEDPAILAEIIRKALDTEIDYNTFELAADKYTWENEEKELGKIYNQI